MGALPQGIKDTVDRLWVRALESPGDLRTLQDLTVACQILTIKLAALEISVRLPGYNECEEVMPMDG